MKSAFLPMVAILMIGAGCAQASGAPRSDVKTPRSGNTENLRWTVSTGASRVAFRPNRLTIKPRTLQPTTDYSLATANWKPTEQAAWRVAFDVRYGRLGTVGTGVGLYSAGTLIGWAGADSWYNVLGVFFGKEFFIDASRKTLPRADRHWHRIEFRGENGQVSVWRDGVKLGERSLSTAPDSLKVGEIHALFGEAPPVQIQSELEVRVVTVPAQP